MLDFAGCGAQTPPTAFAEEPAAPAAELEEEGNLPGVTLGADYCSRQVTRGLPDNTEGIVTLSAALEWLGFTAEVDGIFNTEDISAAFFLNASFIVVGAVEVGAREPVVPHAPRSRQRIETTR